MRRCIMLQESTSALVKPHENVMCKYARCKATVFAQLCGHGGERDVQLAIAVHKRQMRSTAPRSYSFCDSEVFQEFRDVPQEEPNAVVVGTVPLAWTLWTIDMCAVIDATEHVSPPRHRSICTTSG